MNRKCLSLLLSGLLVAAVGCGAKGTITGTVTYKGTPIPTGTIMFVPDNGSPSVTTAITDGKYTAEKVAAGPAKIGITSTFVDPHSISPMQKMMQKGKGGPPPEAPEAARKAFEAGAQASKKGIKIPDEFANPDTSKETYTVKGGSQVHDIDLK